jgi:predicted bacteriocin transport accessory protein
MAMVALIFLTGCSDSDKVYTELSYDELQTKLDNKDSFVLVIGSSTCSACAKYKETMREVVKDKKVEIFFLDLNQLTDEEYAKIYSKYVVTSTPTTIFISEGLETSTYERIIGAAGYSDIVQSLKTHGYIGD